MKTYFVGEEIKFTIQATTEYQPLYVGIELYQPDGKLFSGSRIRVPAFLSGTVDSTLYQVQGIVPAQAGVYTYKLFTWTDDSTPDTTQVIDALVSPYWGNIKLEYGIGLNDAARTGWLEKLLSDYRKSFLPSTATKEGCPLTIKVDNAVTSGLTYEVRALHASTGKQVATTLTDPQGIATLQLPQGVYDIQRISPAGQVITKRVTHHCKQPQGD